MLNNIVLIAPQAKTPGHEGRKMGLRDRWLNEVEKEVPLPREQSPQAASNALS